MAKENSIYLSIRARINYNHSLISDDVAKQDYYADYLVTSNFLDLVEKAPMAQVAWLIDSVTLGILKRKYPDVLKRIKLRLDNGQDEIELTSYGNTFDSVMTLTEIKLAFSKLLTNEDGVGVADIFGSYTPIYCPVADNFNSSIAKVLKENGIDCVSLSYGSGVINAFSAFVNKLSYENRFNPIVLKTDAGKMTLLPYLDFYGMASSAMLVRLIKRAKFKQNQLKRDLILVLEFEADNNILYCGNVNKSLKKLGKMLTKISDLNFVKFVKPSVYLKTHMAEDAEELVINEAVTKSLFSGLSAFAQKPQVALLWGKIEKSRDLCQRAESLNDFLVDRVDNANAIRICVTNRLPLLNIANFGDATPYINLERFNQASKQADKNVEEAQNIFDRVISNFKEARHDCIEVYPYNSYNKNTPIYNGVVKINTNVAFEDVTDELGAKYPYFYETRGGERTLNVVFKQLSAPQKIITQKGIAISKKSSLLCCANSIENKFIRVVADKASALLYFQSIATNKTIAYLNSSVVYNGYKRAEIDEVVPQINSIEVLLNVKGHIDISQTEKILFLWVLKLVEEVPYLYLEGQVVYPNTKPKYFNKKIAKLNTPYDNRWQEVCPLEITTQFLYGDENYKIGYHDFLNEYKTFELNFLNEQRNKIDCLNNTVTSSYLTVTNKLQGLLIAQDTSQDSSFAFCPIRVVKTNEKAKLLLNPFGAYKGKRLRTLFALNRFSLLDRKLAKANMPSSYNGTTTKFNLMLAPYNGEHITEKMQNDAIMFSYQPTIIINGKVN